MRSCLDIRSLPTENCKKTPEIFSELANSAIIAKRTIDLHLLDQNDNHIPVQKGNIYFNLRRKDHRKVRMTLKRLEVRFVTPSGQI